MFVGLQFLLIGLGWAWHSGGKELSEEATKRLDAMRSALQSVTAVGVVAAIVFTRAKLHVNSVKTAQDLLRYTFIALCIAEVTLAFALVGLAKLHFLQFLMTSALVFVVDFGFILPAGLRLMTQPSPEK